MVETSFNIFDLVVLSIFGLSALLSFIRGFVREVLSLGAWVGASLVTLYNFPKVAEMFMPQMQNSVSASGIAAMVTFIGSLMVLSIFNALLLRLLKKGADVGLLDNCLGLGFGLLRAFLLVSLGYLIFTLIMAEKDYPEWLAGSETRPYVEKGADFIAGIAPDYLEEIAPDKDGEDEPKVIKPDDDVKTDQGEGYYMENIENLERMIENTQQKLKESQPADE